MNLLKRLFNRNNEDCSKNRNPPKENTLLKLNHALHKKNDDLFTDAIKRFFSESYHISSEFTFDELPEIVNQRRIRKNVKKELMALLREINDAYYSSEKIESIKMKEFNERFKALLPHI